MVGRPNPRLGGRQRLGVRRVHPGERGQAVVGAHPNVSALDLAIIKTDALAVSSHVNIDAKNEYFAMIRNRWSEALGNAFAELPDADLVDKGDEFQAQ